MRISSYSPERLELKFFVLLSDVVVRDVGSTNVEATSCVDAVAGASVGVGTYDAVTDGITVNAAEIFGVAKAIESTEVEAA